MLRKVLGHVFVNAGLSIDAAGAAETVEQLRQIEELAKHLEGLGYPEAAQHLRQSGAQAVAGNPGELLLLEIEEGIPSTNTGLLMDEHRQNMVQNLEEIDQKVSALAERVEQLAERLAYVVMVLLVHAGKLDVEQAEEWINKYLRDDPSEERDS